MNQTTPDEQNFNTKKDGKSESISYTLNEKRIHDEKKKFTYSVELTILLITY